MPFKRACSHAFPGIHLILELSRYADFSGLIPLWKSDSIRLAIRELSRGGLNRNPNTTIATVCVTSPSQDIGRG
jgi:hypothetical protein